MAFGSISSRMRSMRRPAPIGPDSKLSALQTPADTFRPDHRDGSGPGRWDRACPPCSLPKMLDNFGNGPAPRKGWSSALRQSPRTRGKDSSLSSPETNKIAAFGGGALSKLQILGKGGWGSPGQRREQFSEPQSPLPGGARFEPVPARGVGAARSLISPEVAEPVG
jgi:hypothetical protein